MNAHTVHPTFIVLPVLTCTLGITSYKCSETQSLAAIVIGDAVVHIDAQHLLHHMSA